MDPIKKRAPMSDPMSDLEACAILGAECSTALSATYPGTSMQITPRELIGNVRQYAVAILPGPTFGEAQRHALELALGHPRFKGDVVTNTPRMFVANVKGLTDLSSLLNQTVLRVNQCVLSHDGMRASSPNRKAEVAAAVSA